MVFNEQLWDWFTVQNYLQWFRSGDEYYLEIINASKELIEREYGGIDEDIISINPTDFFDIQMNSYYFEGFNKALVDAQKKCNDMSPDKWFLSENGK